MTEEQVMKDLKDIKGYFAAINQFKRDRLSIPFFSVYYKKFLVII